MIELHFAHGYLLSSFISPLSNQRSDKYGGALENRMRLPLEVFHIVRDIVPDEKPISARISTSRPRCVDAPVSPELRTPFSVSSQWRKTIPCDNLPGNGRF